MFQHLSEQSGEMPPPPPPNSLVALLLYDVKGFGLNDYLYVLLTEHTKKELVVVVYVTCSFTSSTTGEKIRIFMCVFIGCDAFSFFGGRVRKCTNC